jgi:hypothetical protein
MGYDRQTSPFATRLFLTCYCLFLLVSVLLHTNNIYQRKKENNNSEYGLETIFLGVISLLTFSMNFYGIWFAKIVILCFIVFLFSMLLGTSLISLVIIIANILGGNPNVFLSLKNSLYFAHNYIWLIKASTSVLRVISLSMSCLLNILALWGICHLCSCLEDRHHSWPYRKRSKRISQTII